MGKREIIHLSLRCHHQNDSCIKMGSDESHLNVSLIVTDKVTRQWPQTTTFSRKRRAEAESSRGPSACQPNSLPLGQTRSRRRKGCRSELGWGMYSRPWHFGRSTQDVEFASHQAVVAISCTDGEIHAGRRTETVQQEAGEHSVFLLQPLLKIAT